MTSDKDKPLNSYWLSRDWSNQAGVSALSIRSVFAFAVYSHSQYIRIRNSQCIFIRNVCIRQLDIPEVPGSMGSKPKNKKERHDK
jgi:hypothetical protein